MSVAPPGSTLASNLRRMAPVWALLFVTVLGSLLLIRAKGRDYLREGIYAQEDTCQVAEFHHFAGVRIWRELASEVAAETSATRVQSSLGRFAGDDRITQARGELEEALSLCPVLTGTDVYLADLAWWGGDVAMTHFHLGREHLRNKEWIGARAELETAFAHNPEASRIARALIELTMEQGRLDQLEEFLADVSEEVRRSATGRWAESMLATNRGDFDAALVALREALDMEPGHTMMVRDLTRLHHTRGDYVEGADWLMDNLASARAVDATSYHQALLLYAQAGEYAKALPACDRAIALQPNSVVLLAERALILHNLGRTQEARATIQHAINVNANVFMEIIQDMRFADVEALRGT